MTNLNAFSLDVSSTLDQLVNTCTEGILSNMIVNEEPKEFSGVTLKISL